MRFFCIKVFTFILAFGKSSEPNEWNYVGMKILVFDWTDGQFNFLILDENVGRRLGRLGALLSAIGGRDDRTVYDSWRPRLFR